MASVSPRLALAVMAFSAGPYLAGACSPEARRVRDGGPGGDPGNKRVIEAPLVNPRPADSTLWPGRAPAPVERLAAGTMEPPPRPQATDVAPQARSSSEAEQRAFTKSASDPGTSERR